MGLGDVVAAAAFRKLYDQAPWRSAVTRLDPIFSIRAQAHRAATWAYTRLRTGRSPREGLRILMYHAVGTPIEGDVRSLYNITYGLFERHMRCLAERNADQLVHLDSRESKGDCLRIALSFDDGYRDNLSVAAPLLVELGIPFTVFVCTGAVAGRKAGLLAPEELRELAGLPGARIGSHSINHVRLTEVDDRRLDEELAGSKAYLEDLLGTGVDLLSYPHGAVDRRVRDAAEEAGYCIGATSRFDINQLERDPLLLCRTDIWADDDIAVFEQKLRGDWDWNRWRTADPGRWPRRLR